MLQSAMARAHARAKDKMCYSLMANGKSLSHGLVGVNGTDQGCIWLVLCLEDVSALGGLAVTDFSHDTATEILTSLKLLRLVHRWVSMVLTLLTWH